MCVINYMYIYIYIYIYVCVCMYVPVYAEIYFTVCFVIDDNNDAFPSWLQLFSQTSQSFTSRLVLNKFRKETSTNLKN